MNCATSELDRIANVKAAQVLVVELNAIIKTLTARRDKAAAWLDLPAQKELIEQLTPSKKPEPYPKEFEQDWELYPSRNGIKAEKKSAFARWKLIKPEDRPRLRMAIKNYKASDEGRRATRDMVRFLKEEYWPQWVTLSQSQMERNKEGKNHGQKSASSQTVAEVVAEVSRGSRPNSAG